MFSMLKNQTPVITVSTIKMMRYLITNEHDIDIENKIFDANAIKDLKDQRFATMSGRMLFSIKAVKDEKPLAVGVNSFYLTDHENDIHISDMDVLRGELKEFDDTLILTGDAYVNIKGAKFICRSMLKISHSHDEFFEVEYCFQTDDKSKVIYGITLIEKEMNDIAFVGKTFEAVA